MPMAAYLGTPDIPRYAARPHLYSQGLAHLAYLTYLLLLIGEMYSGAKGPIPHGLLDSSTAYNLGYGSVRRVPGVHFLDFTGFPLGACRNTS